MRGWGKQRGEEVLIPNPIHPDRASCFDFSTQSLTQLQSLTQHKQLFISASFFLWSLLWSSTLGSSRLELLVPHLLWLMWWISLLGGTGRPFKSIHNCLWKFSLYLVVGTLMAQYLPLRYSRHMVLVFQHQLGPLGRLLNHFRAPAQCGQKSRQLSFKEFHQLPRILSSTWPWTAVPLVDWADDPWYRQRPWPRAHPRGQPEFSGTARHHPAGGLAFGFGTSAPLSWASNCALNFER